MAKNKRDKTEGLKRRPSLSSPACYMEEFPEYFGFPSENPDPEKDVKQSKSSDKD